MRVALWTTAGGSLLAAASHQALLDVFGQASDGPAALIATALTWPHPLVQPLLLALTGTLLLAIAGTTGGFRRMSAAQLRVGLSAVGTASGLAVPTALGVLGIVLVIVFAVAILALILWCIVMALS